MSLRVLTVLLDVPVPAVTGSHVRMLANLDIVRGLGCESHVLYFRTEDERGDPEELLERCDTLTCGGQRASDGSFTTVTRILQRFDWLRAGILQSQATHYPFSWRYDAVEAERLICEQVEKTGAEVVVLNSDLCHYAPAIQRAGAAVVADALDVLADLTRQLLKTVGRRQPHRIPSLLVNHLACRAQERRFLPECDEIWATSEREAGMFRQISPGTRTVVIRNVFDHRAVVATDVPEVPWVGFIGTYGIYPNLAGARVLVDDVLPRLRSRHPHVRIRLAGAGLPREVERRFRLHAEVDVLGPVPSSTEFLHTCRIVALPIHIVGGVPLKLVEALGVGRPVVATPTLVESLPLTDGKDILVASTPGEFADAIAHLLSDLERAQELGLAARLTFERHFSVDAMLDRACRSSILAGA